MGERISSHCVTHKHVNVILHYHSGKKIVNLVVACVSSSSFASLVYVLIHPSS